MVIEEALEDAMPLPADIPAHLQKSSQERPQDGHEIPVVVIEALRQPAPGQVQRPQLQKQRILLALEPCVEYHPVYDIVHEQLQPLPDNHSGGARLWSVFEIFDGTVSLILPPAFQPLD